MLLHILDYEQHSYALNYSSKMSFMPQKKDTK
jgi:hypothetical protein